MRAISWIAGSIAVVAMAGCASTGGVRSAPLDAGVSRTYSAMFDQTLQAAREAATEAGLLIDSAEQLDSNTWLIMCKKGTSAWSWGEIVRLVVVKESPFETTVRVYSKRRSAVNLTAQGDYSGSILSNIQLKLQTTS